MTEEQKAARRRALRQCEGILEEYLTDWLTDTDDEDGLIDGCIEGFEHVDPEIDGLRDEIVDLEVNT